MTIDAFHRRAPEIVVEHVAPGGLADHIPVPHNRRYVVVYEVTVERVEIAADRDERDRRVDAPSWRFVRLSSAASAASVSLNRRLTEARGAVVPPSHIVAGCSITTHGISSRSFVRANAKRDHCHVVASRFRAPLLSAARLIVLPGVTALLVTGVS